MSSTSADDDQYVPVRNVHSFDLRDSAAKAAAWAWHLRTSKAEVATEGQRLVSATHIRRSSSSSNYDRRTTRFRQEASATMDPGGSLQASRNSEVWDCDSSLYDTLELVAFSNRLERSLMESLVLISSSPEAHCSREFPQYESNVILRTRSLPESLGHRVGREAASLRPNLNLLKPSESEKKGRSKTRSSAGLAQIRVSIRSSRLGKFIVGIRKVVVLHRQASSGGCRRSTHVIESSQLPALRRRNNGLPSPLAYEISSNEGNYKKSSLIKKSCPESKRADLMKAHDIRPTRSLVSMEDDRIKGSNLEVINVKKRTKDANFMHQDHYGKHLHHHYHHHHHLYDNLAFESARLSPDLHRKKVAHLAYISSLLLTNYPRPPD